MPSVRKNTAKARELRRRQLRRLGFDEDRILDVLDFEFDLDMGTYPGMPLSGKRFENGGIVNNIIKSASEMIQERRDLFSGKVPDNKPSSKKKSNGAMLPNRGGNFKGVF